MTHIYSGVIISAEGQSTRNQKTEKQVKIKYEILQNIIKIYWQLCGIPPPNQLLAIYLYVLEFGWY